MSKAILESSVKPIAVAAITATFQGYADSNGIANKFGSKFASLFASAIQSYVSICIGLPTGGPITPGAIAKLQADLIDCGKQAMIAMFQGESDPNNIAQLFGNGFGPFASIMATYIATCQTILATPPAVPLSPGGPIITVPSSICTPVMLQCANQAMINSFQGQSDLKGLSMIFASAMAPIGDLIATYVVTCIAPPGGGPIQAS